MEQRTEDWAWLRQTKAVEDTVNATVGSLTDSIPRPKTAQATPTPVPSFKMRKARGGFTIGI